MKKFSFLSLFLVAQTSIPVQSQKNVEPPIPSEVETKEIDNLQSLFLDNERPLGAIYSKSVLESVFPSFVSNFLTPHVLDQYVEAIVRNTSETCKRDVVYIWNMLLGSATNLSLPEDYILQS